MDHSIGAVARRAGVSVKAVRYYSDLGLLEVNCLNLFSEDGRQRLLWFTPAVGTDSAERMELLGVVGRQDLTPERG